MGTRTKVVEDVFKYGIPTAALGVSTANMSINASRHKKDEVYQAKQLNAMNNLTNSLNNVNTSMARFNMNNIQQPQPQKKKKGFFRRLFSLYDSSKGVKFRRSINLDGILGDNKIDELRDWLLEKSLDPRLQSETQYSTEDFLNEVSYSVSINQDPRKSVVNLLYSNGVLEILFVNPRPNEISKIDKVLDEYSSKYENTGYIATQPAHSIFHVEIKLKEGTESEVPSMLYEEGFKINVLINKNK